MRQRHQVSHGTAMNYKSGGWRGALAACAAALALCTAAPAHAACVDGESRTCIADDGCPGRSYCDGKVWGECYASTACHQPPPPYVSFQTTGLGAGREVVVTASNSGPGIDRFPTYLFTKGQRQVTFHATGTDSTSGVTSIKLTGTLTVTCARQRLTRFTPEVRGTTTQTLYSMTTGSQPLPSLGTTQPVDFLSFDLENRCSTGSLPWKQEVTLHAEATNAAGLTRTTYQKRFIFMQSFKVATYNIHRGTNSAGTDTIDRIAWHLNQNEVDVVVLQEADSTTVNRLALSPEIGELNRYVRLAGNNDLAIFSKFPVIEHQSLPHSLPISGYDPRWHYVKLDLGGFHAKVANLHLIANSVAHNRDIDPVPHRRQDMEDVMAQMRAPGSPALIAGDINTDGFVDGSGYSVFRNEMEPLAFWWPYQHVCLATGCPATGDDGLRFNLDQIWAWDTTPGLRFVDGYMANPTYGTEPSDHTMQVSRVALREAP
jgi:hypothetical protein